MDKIDYTERARRARQAQAEEMARLVRIAIRTIRRTVKRWWQRFRSVTEKSPVFAKQPARAAR